MFFHQHKSYKGKVVAAGIVGAALGFILGTLKAKKRGMGQRQDFRDWTSQMSNELRERVKNTQDLTQEKYEQMVDAIADKYRKMQNIKQTEVADFSQDLKRRWERIKGEWDK